MKISALFFTTLLVIGCSSTQAPDAYGNFEAVETMVAAETNGKLIYFDVEEGQALSVNQHVATVDTTVPSLHKQELLARRQSLDAKLSGAEAQINVLRQQMQNVQVDLERVQNMLKDDAATQKQLDDVLGAKNVLQKQIDAAEAQKAAIASERNALDANLAVLNEQLSRCGVLNPVDGTVLEKYAEPHELTAAGKPLYKIANLEELNLRAFVSGGQINALKLGQRCTVRIDDGSHYIEYPGSIDWISDTAEFTPKIIQTKEERVNLVYAVKIRVQNDGRIKIGMPGEAIF